MDISLLLNLLGILATAALAGFELAVGVVLRMAARLDEGPRIAMRIVVAQRLGAVMPVAYVVTIAVVAAAFVVPLVGGRIVWGNAYALGGMLGSLVVTLVSLVPRNRRIVSWGSEGTPDDAWLTLENWDAWHLARVALIVMAAAALVLATTAMWS